MSQTRDHYTREPADWVGAASDVGCKHSVNQDALSVAVRDTPDRSAVLAISDGVSTALHSEIASSVAVQTVTDRIISHLDHPTSSIHAAINDAFELANQAVLDVGEDSPSACTLILAIVTTGKIWVANIGDTRAYWLGDDGSVAQLSTDDSMAQARIALGLSREAAEQGGGAHAITKWLGRDSTDVTPGMQVVAPESDGYLVICSDGLWNYASAPAAFQALFQKQLNKYSRPVDIAEALVEWAKESGGKDNITVALARYQTDSSPRGE